ncbi:sarcosine oxidase subunit alpha family protein [Aliiruegeria sabulilitoris]|uniref:sarcosine oxidase subunit alpha family protein n=1 Tax=Aliiruegeria sabulilitoris TaxID=1510458 RepID=UPI000830F5C4|nr:sarcosine oxidase subunit alpha family protein [Aliiruegeria sabulilitoris]NDR59609.1 sarcosine oxidase subunit alpha family protein [Pseudoruegeria sp. M32A2M]
MRLPNRGRIDRSVSLPFSFDGRLLTGHPGDTLASALLANGIRLMGRSFKYHRPRGVMTAGSEEPNALMEIGSGATMVPNVRATVQELYEGLEAHSQNHWPSLSADLLALNDLFAPFLGAGFYYKTFMWPRSFWERLYEPAIRHAAGLGRLTTDPDPARHEKAFAHCDLLVIGAGPAGLSAALVAGKAGADVILADESNEPGGRLLTEQEYVDGEPAARWVAATRARLAQMDNVRIMPRTTVTGAYDGGVYGAHERVSEHLAARPRDLPLDCFWRITTRAAVLATGAIERPIAFPENDRPGIMMAGALRSYVNRYGVSPGRKVALFAYNDDAHRTARDMQDAGMEVAGVIDPRSEPPEGDYPVFSEARVVATRGRHGLRQVQVQSKGGATSIAADVLAVSGGWNPSLHLSCHMGGRPQWNETIEAFVPRPGAVPGLVAAGAANGVYDTAGCLAEGKRAAGEALAILGVTAPDWVLPEAESDAGSGRTLWLVEGKGRAWLDFQNDVTTKDVKGAVQEGYDGVEYMKRYTTQGMAPDQGKNSNVNALAILADATGRSIAATGTTIYRPPYAPLPIGVLGAGAQSKGFAPERLTPSHAACLARGAPMVEAGLWYRPSYFPAPGETTWRESCDREVRMVRGAVGICDVSTLGKIELQGPDVGLFLDFVYANGFSKLKPGRVRYGIMLREDGHVMDDGTTARLSENHWVMTTTTAAAGQVMAHLEMVQQCFLPRARVRFTSTTDSWAQFAIAGPRALDVLNTVLDSPTSAERVPFMACGAVRVGGMEARLFRISFSGELAFELAVPTRVGASLWRLLLAQAEGFGGGPYGMEALNVLRIEKGFLTHAEMHGRTTAFDLGLQNMLSRRKDFIGKAASTRPGLRDEGREQLVGLVSRSRETGLSAGAHLFAADAAPERLNDQGYVTSSAWSPTLERHIALGFLRNGRARHGERLRLVDHLRGVDVNCEVCDPVFLDPEGGRMR